MSHDGTEDPVDYSISNAIYELLNGIPPDEVADTLGWDMPDLATILPGNISNTKLDSLADENYWPSDHVEELKTEIRKFVSSSK